MLDLFFWWILLPLWPLDNLEFELPVFGKPFPRTATFYTEPKFNAEDETRSFGFKTIKFVPFAGA